MKIGKVSIIGKPNVGKSTFLNVILNKKHAIVSYKPQTTRNNIKGLYCSKESQIIFIDTPGFHKSKNKLDLFLNSNVKKAIKESDLFLFLTDPGRDLDEEDFSLIKFIKNNQDQIIVLLTKNDLYNESIIEKRIMEINNIINPKKIFSISSIKQDNIKNLMKYISDNLIESEFKLIEGDDIEKV